MAYLNYLLFDEDYNFVDAGFAQVSESSEGMSAPHDLLQLEVDIKQNGYIYIYTSNENDEDLNVFFDDFLIRHFASPEILESTDYYPFGSVMRQFTKPGFVNYRFGYQGEFAEEDEETGWNHFELRQYHSKIGRWLNIDPQGQYSTPYLSMGNSPINKIDSDGGVADWFIVRYGENKGTVIHAPGKGVGYAKVLGPDVEWLAPDGNLSQLFGALKWHGNDVDLSSLMILGLEKTGTSLKEGATNLAFDYTIGTLNSIGEITQTATFPIINQLTDKKYSWTGKIWTLNGNFDLEGEKYGTTSTLSKDLHNVGNVVNVVGAFGGSKLAKSLIPDIDPVYRWVLEESSTSLGVQIFEDASEIVKE